MFLQENSKQFSIFADCNKGFYVSVMKILLANNHLQKTGGTENYIYALAVELKRQGHIVEYFTFRKGPVSELLEREGVPFMTGKRYDLILANHKTCVRKLHRYGFTIQTCHGTVPSLEQPNIGADFHVSVTEEVKRHLVKKGYRSIVIKNGIDCRRFAPHKPVSSELSCVLSLCQSDELNETLKDYCTAAGVKFLSCNKHTDNVWSIEEKINEADMVIGIGRSLYDAMACGRCVISYDCRGYMKAELGDGYITADNIEAAIACNCSGRGSGRRFTKDEFIDEMMKYNPADAHWARNYALEHLNIEKVVEDYIAIKAKYWNSCALMRLSKRSVVFDWLNIAWKSISRIFR